MIVCVREYRLFELFVPFIVKLKSVLAIQRCDKLPDHSLRLLPLISPQHPHMGHQPGHCAYCHTAHFPLDVVSYLLCSERGQKNNTVAFVGVEEQTSSSCISLRLRDTNGKMEKRNIIGFYGYRLMSHKPQTNNNGNGNVVVMVKARIFGI